MFSDHAIVPGFGSASRDCQKEELATKRPMLWTWTVGVQPIKVEASLFQVFSHATVSHPHDAPHNAPCYTGSKCA